jgi:hypothetical protein
LSGIGHHALGRQKHDAGALSPPVSIYDERAKPLKLSALHYR